MLMKNSENIDAPSLKYDQDLLRSMDYFFLRKEGIRYVQELSGKIWTDYNEHDPGVTILEQCCFALTDLAYRTNTSIEKILFSNGDKRQIAASNGLYAPEEILLSSDVTLLDHKIFFLDKLKNISNVWFRKAEGIDINGLYDIIVQPVSDQIQESEIEKNVRELFAANRNLCEDINKVIILEPEDLELSVTIDVYEEYGVEEVLAEIYFQLDSYFSKKVQFDSLEILVDQGGSYEQIFDRPSFDKSTGFINVSDMKEFCTAYSFSKIQSKILAVKGVRNAQGLVIKKDGIKIGGEQVNVQEGNFVSVTAILEKPAIVVNRNHTRVEYNIENVKSLYHQKIAEATKKYFSHSSEESKNELASGKENSAYTSIQNTFPVTYGIGNYGLSENEENERKFYAKQLQGYLLFFDQILLNHLAQLKNIPDLFSIEGEQTKTYFEQLPFNKKSIVVFPESPVNIPNAKELINPDMIEKEQLLHSFLDDPFDKRKNKLLNHLLARFSEKFVEETHHNLRSIYGLSSRENIDKTLMKLKTSYLSQYRFLSKNRNKGYDFNRPEWNGKALVHEQEISPVRNVYPFKKKMFLLLNLPEKNEGMGSLLSDYTQVKIQNVSRSEKEEMRSEYPVTGEEGQYYYKPYKESNSKKITFLLPENTAAVDNLIYYGGRRDSYFISKSAHPGHNFFLSFKAVSSDLHLLLGEYGTNKEGEEVIEKLIEKFTSLNERSEGFHVVEHILLRPVLELQYEIHITVEKEDKEQKKKPVLLKTMLSDTYEANKQLLTELITLGTQKNNFVIEEEKSGELQQQLKTYQIVLQDKSGNRLLLLDKVFGSVTIAQSYIDDTLVKLFKNMAQERTIIPSAVYLNSLENTSNSETISGYSADLHPFFDSGISLLFPDWVPRFNEPDFRALLKASIEKCLPAHIYVNVIWVNKKNMREFEKVYLDWMRLKSDNFIHEFKAGEEGSTYRKENIRLREHKSKLDKLSAKLMEKLKQGPHE